MRTENGQYGTFDFYGQQTFIDPMNPETRAFVWNKVKDQFVAFVKDGSAVLDVFE